jgi:hypothetical protein
MFVVYLDALKMLSKRQKLWLLQATFFRSPLFNTEDEGRYVPPKCPLILNGLHAVIPRR